MGLRPLIAKLQKGHIFKLDVFHGHYIAWSLIQCFILDGQSDSQTYGWTAGRVEGQIAENVISIPLTCGPNLSAKANTN